MRLLPSIVCLALIGCIGVATLPIQAQAPVQVTGSIIELNKPGTIEVSISLGEDDGLRVGAEAKVRRNGAEVGTLKVVKTQPDRAIARIVDVAQGKSIEKTDEVTLQFRLAK